MFNVHVQFTILFFLPQEFPFFPKYKKRKQKKKIHFHSIHYTCVTQQQEKKLCSLTTQFISYFGFSFFLFFAKIVWEKNTAFRVMLFIYVLCFLDLFFFLYIND